MFQQVTDFADESLALYQILRPLSADKFDTATQFKQWTFDDIIGHLHLWNWGADLSLTDENRFMEFLNEVMGALKRGSLKAFERQWLNGLAGPELLHTWYGFVNEMTDRFGAADPKRRVKWAGPDMSVRSSITARLMETWAHGMAVYDSLGLVREDTDRIKNIAILGVNTFGWTFINRNLPVPEPMPYLRLVAPSGAIWEWGDPATSSRIHGSATGFCQTVTQVRHVSDTDLTVTGADANAWMQKAQCFAGPPESPPRPGERHVQ